MIEKVVKQAWEILIRRRLRKRKRMPAARRLHRLAHQQLQQQRKNSQCNEKFPQSAGPAGGNFSLTRIIYVKAELKEYHHGLN